MRTDDPGRTSLYGGEDLRDAKRNEEAVEDDISVCQQHGSKATQSLRREDVCRRPKTKWTKLSSVTQRQKKKEDEQ